MLLNKLFLWLKLIFELGKTNATPLFTKTMLKLWSVVRPQQFTWTQC